jgi:hypothetical protein
VCIRVGFVFGAMALVMACTGVWGRAISMSNVMVRSDAAGVKDPVTGTSTPEGDALLDRVKGKMVVRKKSVGEYTPSAVRRDTRTPHSGSVSSLAVSKFINYRIEHGIFFHAKLTLLQCLIGFKGIHKHV